MAPVRWRISWTQSAACFHRRTVVGGNAALQKAICLDSMGQSEEARPIYAQLSKHSSAYVAKMANRMSFGFAAMKNLKADTISYAVSKKEWRPYFDTFTDRNYKVYVPPPDEVTDNTGAAVAALAVMALPLVLVGAFAYVH